jgi:hypothetical protein
MNGARLADLPAITPERVLELKAEAKALKESTGAKHTVVLAQLAQREGFPSWERLCAKAGGRDAVDETRRAQPNERRDARAQRQAGRRADHEARQLARDDAAMGRDLERAARAVDKASGGAS